jgi:membrane protein
MAVVGKGIRDNVLVRIVRSALDDNITGEAAKAAYYFFLSLFPMILAIFALTGIFGGEAAFAWIMDQLQRALPEDTSAYLETFVREITDQPRPGLLSVGLLLTLWAASNFFAALGDGLDAMYDVKGRSSWFRKRGKAILLFLVGSVTLLGGATLVLAGPALARWLGLGPLAALVRWPLAFGLLTLLLFLTYYIMPARDQSGSKRFILVGALAGATLWILVTAAFRLYASNFGAWGDTYGMVGAIIVLLLWLYLSSLAMLFGGEIAEVVEERDRGEGPAVRSGEARRAA